MRMRMIKTSPIEITADRFGNRIFIVATKTDVTARISHCRENSFGALKHNTANGTDARYAAAKKMRQLRDCCCQCIRVAVPPEGGAALSLSVSDMTTRFWRKRCYPTGGCSTILYVVGLIFGYCCGPTRCNLLFQFFDFHDFSPNYSVVL